MIRCIHIDHIIINNNGCHIYFCFIMTGGTDMQKTYFMFEILHYAIKYKILKLLLSYLEVMISCEQLLSII